VSQLFQRKPIAALVADTEGLSGLKRSLRAGDLIMLAIGAVIGAGIFGAIGTAAAGQLDAQGHVVREGAGPALVFSFLLLGAACALAGLCYAELASMIPQAGSAYAYSYATLGELVAWIIGWDLILEYAVGNVAVAISWGDYFNTLLRGIGVEFPQWLTTGYRTALLSPDAPVHGLLQSAPHILGIPVLINVPAFAIVMLITWLLLRGARESATANNIMVIIKLLALTLFAAVGVTHLKGANYHPFAPNGFTGIHLGAAVSVSAVLLVFQYGQPRIFFAMARDGLLPQWAAKLHPRTRIPWATTLLTGIFVALWSLVGDAGETYDLTNIGTLFAFILVSVGVLVLRYKEPERPRPFRVPFVWPVSVLSAAGCLFIMKGLPDQAWKRFGGWLVIGLLLYFLYGFKHSVLRKETDSVPSSN
jgi:amino acid transporter